ncbi:MAG: DUF2334 domain-containing protein [Ilumatobacteraceae bacterium]
MIARSTPTRRFRRSIAVALVAASGLVGATVASVAPVVSAPHEAVAAATTTLVLYDTTGAYGLLGEQYAMLTANLTSHFGAYTAMPVTSYKAGTMKSYTAVVYIGSTYDEPIPTAFLDDVIAGTKPVIWMNSNIWQLTNRQFESTGEYWANARGWDWSGYDTSPISEVGYKGRVLGRYSADLSGILQTTIYDPAKASVIAVAKRADGSEFPWAVRSGNLTYIGEIPLSYMSENNRYLVFADLLFDALAPTTPERHRALVRIEDVSAKSDPAELRAVADTLAAEKVPFSVTVVPQYRDPKGVLNNGKREVVSLWQAPEVVSALRYMQSKGGTLIMHGFTHQLDGQVNPYNQVTGDDFEFFMAHVDAADSVIYDGSVPGDSTRWANNRIARGKAEFWFARLATPTIFTPPHYAASAADYASIRSNFKARYDRGIYFSGQLSGGKVSTTQFVGQFFPYPVKDINGSIVVPENLGNEELDAFNNHPARLPQDVIDNAAANLVVRDGMASFFWHPFLVGDPRAGTAHLQEIVRGIKALGYTFVSADSIALAKSPNALGGSSLATGRILGTHLATGPMSQSHRGGSSPNPSAPDAVPGTGTVAEQAASTETTIPAESARADRKPFEPPINIGEQLLLDPDEGPALTADT